MRLQLAGFDEAISIRSNAITIVEIENKVLFTRVCQSILSGQGEYATEPYLVWGDDDIAVRPDKAFLVILCPLDLPWMDKELGSKLYSRLDTLLIEEDDVRQSVESLNHELTSKLSSLSMLLHSEYSFAIEWDVRKYLKAFGFGVDFDPEGRLLDNLVRFLELAKDVGFDKVLAFVNLKTFFSKKELIELYEQVVFSGIKVLALENYRDNTVYELESKSLIDQHFMQ